MPLTDNQKTDIRETLQLQVFYFINEELRGEKKQDCLYQLYIYTWHAATPSLPWKEEKIGIFKDYKSSIDPWIDTTPVEYSVGSGVYETKTFTTAATNVKNFNLGKQSTFAELPTGVDVNNYIKELIIREIGLNHFDAEQFITIAANHRIDEETINKEIAVIETYISEEKLKLGAKPTEVKPIVDNVVELKQAADNGDADACLQYANYLLQPSIKKIDADAVTYLITAERLGNIEALKKLAELSDQDPVVKSYLANIGFDYPNLYQFTLDVRNLKENARDTNNINANILLAIYYINSQMYKLAIPHLTNALLQNQDNQRALNYLRYIALKYNIPEANPNYILGKFAYDEKNYKKAAPLLVAAICDGSMGEECTTLLSTLSQKDLPIFRQGMTDLRGNAAQGNPHAHYYLGTIYEVSEDIEKAFNEYSAAVAQQPFAKVYHALGNICSNDSKHNANYFNTQEAIKYFTLAANMGHEPSFLKLKKFQQDVPVEVIKKCYFELGKNHYKRADVTEAIKHWEKAAFEFNDEKSFQELQKLAVANNEAAQLALAKGLRNQSKYDDVIRWSLPLARSGNKDALKQIIGIAYTETAEKQLRIDLFKELYNFYLPQNKGIKMAIPYLKEAIELGCEESLMILEKISHQQAALGSVTEYSQIFMDLGDTTSDNNTAIRFYANAALLGRKDAIKKLEQSSPEAAAEIAFKIHLKSVVIDKLNSWKLNLMEKYKPYPHDTSSTIVFINLASALTNCIKEFLNNETADFICDNRQNKSITTPNDLRELFVALQEDNTIPSELKLILKESVDKKVIENFVTQKK